jgi:kumamolisin
MQGASRRVEIRAGRYRGADNVIVGDVNRDDRIVVTVIVRPRTPIPTNLAPFAHITREIFLERHGASTQDLDAVVAFATQHDIEATVDAVRRTVVMRAPLGAYETAFAITMAMYAGNDGTHRGYQGIASVPKELADIVVAVIGLHTGGAPSGASTSTGAANGYGPNVVRRALGSAKAMQEFYGFPDGNGEGQCIGIIEMGGGYRRADVDTYFASLGVAPQIKDIVVTSPTHSGANLQVADDEEKLLLQFAQWMNGKGPCALFAKPYFEVTMDVSMIGALAPKAQIQVFFGYDSVRAFLYLIEEALLITDPQPSVLSISWGFQEREILNDPSDIVLAHQINEMFLAAAHMGVTICCSGGDWGASNQVDDGFPGDGYDVEFPASSPYALACGGTTIAADNTEVVWNADFPPPSPDVPKESYKHGATGGGYSKLFDRPPWQRELANQGNGVDPDKRAVPDVAAVADPQCGMRCMMAGATFPTGGTSAAAPMWAALVARLNQQLGRRVGCLNPILYGHAQSHPGVLNDITVGDNRFNRDDVGFDAAPGWDACTGLGTPNGNALLDLLRTILRDGCQTDGA